MNKNSSGTVYSGTDVYMQMCVQRFIYADVCTVIYICRCVYSDLYMQMCVQRFIYADVCTAIYICRCVYSDLYIS